MTQERILVFVLLLLAVVSLSSLATAEEKKEEKLENDTADICNMETKKGFQQLREKYKERIRSWKELQGRACSANVTIEEANKGLQDCIYAKVNEMKDGQLKTAYLHAFDKCLKKVAPIKEMCNETEQKERVYCFAVEARNGFKDNCLKYVDDQVEQRKMFTLAFECLDQKLKEKKK